ncbi:hypothetical protein IV507_05130 [Acinetobacter nosocomialis]|uniref:hypothetical protein n=1 Tax=Acinetobacter nosocomialis TaxID=106654 RepID=UPI002F426A8E
MYDYEKEKLKAKKLKLLILMLISITASRIGSLFSIQPLAATIFSIICFILALFFAIKYIKTVRNGK